MTEKPTYEELEQRVRDLEKRILEFEVLDRTLAESEARCKGIVEHTVNGVAVYRAVKNGEDFIFVDFNTFNYYNRFNIRRYVFKTLF